MTDDRRRVLVLTGHYLPGFRAGGPIRSIENLVTTLSDEYRFDIVTGDRDLGDATPYAGVEPRGWTTVGPARVAYLRPGPSRPLAILRIIVATPHDIIYLNSAFSPTFTLLPLLLRRLGKAPAKRTIVAPRGEFSPGALALKRMKKRSFFAVARESSLFAGVDWHASSTLEETDIRATLAHLGTDSSLADIYVAPNLSALPDAAASASRSTKQPGTLRLVFLSRISPKKNLHGALAMLADLKGEVTFDIYGPSEDVAYWGRCKEIVATLPANVTVRHRGSVEPAQVGTALAGYDLFFLPTLGENFGHAISEALIAGCPVLLSDQTPWRHLEEAGVGWDIPLNARQRFTTVLQHCVGMGEPEFTEMSRRAQLYGTTRARNPDNARMSREMFRARTGEWSR